MKVSLSNNNIIQQRNISNVRNQRNNKSAKAQNSNGQVSFKGAGTAATAFLDFLATNPVWGATATDVGFMGTPTTLTEISRRGLGYGAEAAFREYTSTINDACVGLYGLGAGTVLAGALAKGIDKPQKIFASNESVDVHTALWKDSNGDVNKYVDKYVDNLKGFNPNSDRADAKGYVSIEDGELKNSIKNDMKSVLDTNIDNKQRDKILKRLGAEIVEATGSDAELVLSHGDKSVTSSIGTVTDDFYKMTKAMKENGNVSKIGEFASKLKRFGKGRAMLGLGAAMAVSSCFQPINVWLTKKRTGSDGFGGDSSKPKDNSAKFKAKKLASMAAMSGIMLATLKAKPSQFIDKMMYKGMAPTVDQFKGLYGITILSRMWMGRQDDELREINIKSILGYLNWLVLGNVVEKGVAYAMEKKGNPILKYNKEGSKDGFIFKHFGEKVDKFFNGSITSRREMISEALKKESKSVLNADGTAKNMKQLLKDAKALNNPALNKNLKLRTIAQLANYAYSGIVLGFGVPFLNISITNGVTKKRNAKKEHENIMKTSKDMAINNQIQQSSFAEMKKNYSKTA